MNAKCWSLTAHFCKAVIVIFRQTWDSNLLLAKEIRSLSVVFLQNRKMFNVLYPGIQCLGCHLCNPMVLSFSSAILECSEYSWILWILNIDSLGERFEDNGSLVALEWVIPYISYIGMCCPIGYGFCAILVWNRVWFSRELQRVWKYLWFQFQTSKKEREVCEFEMVLKNFFCLHSNLSNDNIISTLRPGLKMGMNFIVLVWKRVWKITFFGLKSDLKNQIAHPTKNSHEYPPPPPLP